MPKHKMFQINSSNLPLSQVIIHFLHFMTNGDKQLVVKGMLEQKLQNQPTKSPEIASNSATQS